MFLNDLEQGSYLFSRQEHNSQKDVKSCCRHIFPMVEQIYVPSFMSRNKVHCVRCHLLQRRRVFLQRTRGYTALRTGVLLKLGVEERESD
jgi:hypothetical protein